MQGPGDLPFAATFAFNSTLTLPLILFRKLSYQAADGMELEVDKLQLNWSLEKGETIVPGVLSGEGWPAVFLLFPDWQPQRSGLMALYSLPSFLFPLWLRQALRKASQIPTSDSSGNRGKAGGTIPSGYQSAVFFFTLVSIWKTCLGFHSWGKVIPTLISLEMRERHISYPLMCPWLHREMKRWTRYDLCLPKCCVHSEGSMLYDLHRFKNILYLIFFFK